MQGEISESKLFDMSSIVAKYWPENYKTWTELANARLAKGDFILTDLEGPFIEVYIPQFFFVYLSKFF